MKIVERARLSCQQAAALFSEASGGATLQLRHSALTQARVAFMPDTTWPVSGHPQRQAWERRAERSGDGVPEHP